MNNQDITEFTLMWRTAWESLGQTPSDSAIAMTYKILLRFELKDIERAIIAHLETSTFAPKPADIIKLISSSDGRPEPDEAWAIALEWFDERATVIVNDEIAGAMDAARDIYLNGDSVGARMAFKAAYEKALTKARASGERVKWWPSLGQDKRTHAPAIEQAVIQGRLTHTHGEKLLQQQGGSLAALADQNPAFKKALAQLNKR